MKRSNETIASELDHRRVAEGASHPAHGLAGAQHVVIRSLRSDWPSILMRLATIAVTYGLIARAILAEPLPAILIALPFIIEQLAYLWLGLFLAAFVDDHRFRNNALRPLMVIIWTGVWALGLFVWLSMSTTSGSPQLQLANVATNFADARHRLFSSGLHWAFVAMLGSVVITMLFDLHDWKRRGGSFTWPSSATAGLRLGCFLFSLPILLVLGFLFEPLIVPWYSRNPDRAGSWLIWGMLLLLDIAVVLLGALIHRWAVRRQIERRARQRQAKRTR